jgi:hypothetical protein
MLAGSFGQPLLHPQVCCADACSSFPDQHLAWTLDGLLDGHASASSDARADLLNRFLTFLIRSVEPGLLSSYFISSHHSIIRILLYGLANTGGNSRAALHSSRFIGAVVRRKLTKALMHLLHRFITFLNRRDISFSLTIRDLRHLCPSKPLHH